MLILFILSSILFIIGCSGLFFVRKHIIISLISLELIILAININFIGASVFTGDLTGQMYALVMLSVAAAEISIGLALLIVYYRLRGGIALDMLKLLKGGG